MAIRYFEETEFKQYLCENYCDELMDMNCIDGDDNWIDENFLPLFALTIINDQENPKAELEELNRLPIDDYLENISGFIFYDSSKNHYIYATTDEWERTNIVNSFSDFNIVSDIQGEESRQMKNDSRLGTHDRLESIPISILVKHSQPCGRVFLLERSANLGNLDQNLIL